MDENKIPVVEETKNEALEAENAAAEIENQVAEVVTAAVAEEDTTEEKEVRQLPTSKEGVIERLKEIVHNGGEADRAELEALKQTYYRLHNAEAVAEREAFISGGGVAEDFVPSPDAEEENFKAQMSLIRELRAKAVEAAEKEKQENLEKKLAIIEKIKEMGQTQIGRASCRERV